ncbi:MAG: hypothetical protein KBS44_01465 [Clostridiales bacterium]|nr:hypothetical protein [Candidatus Coliplasma equi]
MLDHDRRVSAYRALSSFILFSFRVSVVKTSKSAALPKQLAEWKAEQEKQKEIVAAESKSECAKRPLLILVKKHVIVFSKKD